MSFLAPLWLAGGALAALGVVALHLIAKRRPPPAVLPTARFVPAGDVRAARNAARPADRPLLLLRVVLLLVLGAAFAGPVTRPRGASLARVVLVDRSRGAMTDVRDSALALAGPGDAIVMFDSAVHSVEAGGTDSVRALTIDRASGSLSAALVGARRAARALARRADSVELVIVSPLTSDEFDAATTSLLAGWPGRIRVARTAAAPVTRAVVTLTSFSGTVDDDELRPTVAALNARAHGDGPTADVRLLRRGAAAADSAAARAGAAVVVWPGSGSAVLSAQGVWSGGTTIVAPLARLPVPPGGLVEARWADGARAAVEYPAGRGCIREIGVGVPHVGDLTLQPAFADLASALLAPCDGANTSRAAPDSTARALARGGGAAPAVLLRAVDANSPLAPWLMGVALALLLAELFVRRDTREPLP